MDAADILQTLTDALPAATLVAGASADMPVIYVERDQLIEVCRTLRDHPALQFALLSDVTAVDGHPATPRFEVIYHLACLGAGYAVGAPAPARRLRLKVRLAGADDIHVPTLVRIYPVANWLEREVFDLFGVIFDGHPDLRRLLTPEDWEGHPLRKDYAVQIRKDAQSWSPLQLTAEEFARNIRDQRDRNEFGPESKRSGSTPPAGGTT